ncbi:MAG: FprA family A-type flavoprotein [Theionarchaea archaeon]|nr:FprA family A-type flavoprotein [Theionarchaea archaeon]MBU7038073.1 FprA family A-type flavoprotein [Theionarchaea archaeon]
MTIRKIKEGIYWAGSLDWDRRLFDELIPLPDGTTYNSYIVEGEKTALIDTVDPTKGQELVDNLTAWGGSIDFVVANHAEQDHSGSIPRVLTLFPHAKVVTNSKCKNMLMDLLLIPEEKFLTVNDGETLSLGNRTLQFFMTPWVHWPETMVTYLKEERILFSCDFLGSHLAASHLFARDKEKVFESAKRYYAEIMMPFRTSIRSHLEKLDALTVNIVAPSHGPLHDEPHFILDCYREWVSDTVKNEVVLPFVSMHQSTRAMVDYLVDALIDRNITVKPFNLIQTDIGELAKALVDAATLVIACPTVLAGPHPAAVYAAYLAGALRPKTRIVGIIGSYGWGGKSVETLSQLIQNLTVEVLDPVLIKGYPEQEDFRLLENLADEILKKHKALNI